MIEGRYSELILFDLKKGINVEHENVNKVSACLLVSDSKILICKNLIVSLVNNGCKFFMSWGEFSDEIHDELDSIIEEAECRNLDVTTTSHAGESLEEVSWFFVNATFPMEKIRYFLGYDESFEKKSELIECINRYIADHDQ